MAGYVLKDVVAETKEAVADHMHKMTILGPRSTALALLPHLGTRSPGVTGIADVFHIYNTDDYRR
ncbi:hypothetical protein HOY80DRAFT_1036942 [Tuber brumale]|nr:hypothetical protein HOY80DRAFT_1040642 [Tuber brumale]KAG0642354.1 hypothetical protein HOY80DRAFT_1036942 [Tuber brumale]